MFPRFNDLNRDAINECEISARDQKSPKAGRENWRFCQLTRDLDLWYNEVAPFENLAL